jgi:hypothetical protein
MADSDSIMQLGVAAARDGNRDEARNLFRLLTRQEPENAQAWLWLAGVAEGRDERQAALERVLELDPDNDMAQKGLAALGVDVAALKLAHANRAAPTVYDLPEAATLGAAPADPMAGAIDARSRYDIDDDDPFAQLDTLSEAMADNPEAVRRTAPRPAADDPFASLDEMSDAMAGSNAVRRDEGPRQLGDQPRYTSPPRSSGRTTASRRAAAYDEDEPAPRQTNPLILALLGVLLAFLLLWMLNQFGLFNGFFGGEQTADVAPTSELVASPEPEAAGQPTLGPAVQPTDPATGEPLPDANQPAPDANQPAPDANQPAPDANQPAPDANQPAPDANQPAPDAPSLEQLASANPALVSPGQPIQTAGGAWTFNFPTASYANTFSGPIGGIEPTGRFVVVLITVNNNSGQPQSIPANFFVLKDAQGRVYGARPDVSTAYVNTFGRGLAADLSMEDQIAADGLTRSVPLMFDVAPDATGLVLFAADNPSQGYTVLERLQ